MTIRIENDEIEVEAKEKKDSKKATIIFNQNEIEIGKDNGIALFLITNTQVIEYQTIKYELTKEELIALYFKQILRELAKEFILKEFEVISEDEQKKIVVEDSIDILYNAETINHKLN